jgi:uncharacterized membrane protein
MSSTSSSTLIISFAGGIFAGGGMVLLGQYTPVMMGCTDINVVLIHIHALD